MTWDVDGQDWKKRTNGTWHNLKANKQPPTVTYHNNNIVDTCKTLGHHIDPIMPVNPTDIRLDKLNDSTANINFHQGQSDSGANASATNNLSLLDDVTWIKPLSVGTANGEDHGRVTMQAVGQLTINSQNGDELKVACYYSPNLDGTIISPQAIAMEHKDRFFGWIHFCNTDSKTGYIRLCNRPNSKAFSFGIWCENNLWFQQLAPKTKSNSNNEQVQSNNKQTTTKLHKLNTAAEYELWHQRLAHCGQDTLLKMHNHAKGIPKLSGRNAFYKCPSCMTGKITKTPYKRDKQKYRSNHRKARPKQPNQQNIIKNNPEQDDIFMPHALPGQHFHMDFGFVRGGNYNIKTEQGKTITSVDGKTHTY
jgi:hypothetical protein